MPEGNFNNPNLNGEKEEVIKKRGRKPKPKEEDEDDKNDPDGTFVMPENPLFMTGEHIPSESVKEQPENLENILGYKVQKVENLGTIRIEYIGHETMEGKNNTVDHVFYFKSQLRDMGGNISDHVFYASGPRESHTKSMGGNVSINRWFLDLRNLEITQLKVLRPEWVKSDDKNKKGYYRYLCSVNK